MTQKRYTEIPKRQKCINKEEPYIGGAKDILDDELNKPQSQINDETNQRVSTLEESVGTGDSVDERIATAKSEVIGDAGTDYNTLGKLEDKLQEEVANRASQNYTKAETYNKTELNNMITTPSQEYVTVTATDQTTAVTDVLPATGEADTVYRVGNWDGSQYDTTCYTEYSWNGSAYVKLNTKEYGIDEVPTSGSKNLVESGGVREVLDEVCDLQKKITSSLDLRYNATGWEDYGVDSQKGCLYQTFSGNAAGLSTYNFSRGLRVSINKGKYHLFVKVGLVVEGNDDIRATIAFYRANATTDDKTCYAYANDGAMCLYLGTLEHSNNSSGAFYPARFSAFRNRAGESVIINITGRIEYYGGYLIEDSLLEGIDPNDYTELASQLDYSSLSSIIVLDGNFKKLEERVGVIEESTENLPQITNDVNTLNSGITKFNSSINFAYDSNIVGSLQTTALDNENKYKYAEINALDTSQSCTFTSSIKNIVAGKKYAVFAKVKCVLENIEETDGWTADAITLYHGDYTENVNTIPVNQDKCLYLGEITSSASAAWFYFLRVQNFRKNGQATGATLTVKYIYYDGYIIDTDLLTDISDRESFAELLDYSEQSTVVANASKISMHSAISEESQHSLKSDNANRASIANSLSTILEGKRAGIIGDSLVTYLGTLGNIINYLELSNFTNVGKGGGQVDNDVAGTVSGFCTFERLAVGIPRNTKVLLLYGGANDYNLIGAQEVDLSRVGTINDAPLGIADMFEHRVTVENSDIIDTPGRTPTFYCAYKTWIRNVQLLVPNCLIICVTQHKYYVWDGSHENTITLRPWAPYVRQAIIDVAEDMGVPVLDLWSLCGVNKYNCTAKLNLYDGGSLIHPVTALADYEKALMLNSIVENAAKISISDYNINNTEAKKELDQWYYDMRAYDDSIVLTLQEAIDEFIQHCITEDIELKNNMYIVFRKSMGVYNQDVGYFLINKDAASNVNSWEEYKEATVYDMRKKDVNLDRTFGVQTLSEAINNFIYKATVEEWNYDNQMYMYFLTDANNNWSMYRLTTPVTPSSTSSWTLVKTSQS